MSKLPDRLLALARAPAPAAVPSATSASAGGTARPRRASRRRRARPWPATAWRHARRASCAFTLIFTVASDRCASVIFMRCRRAWPARRRRAARAADASARRASQARKRRQARARPVQTSTTAPAEARPATAWPTRPPASPVWVQRTQARNWRPRRLARVRLEAHDLAGLAVQRELRAQVGARARAAVDREGHRALGGNGQPQGDAPPALDLACGARPERGRARRGTTAPGARRALVPRAASAGGPARRGGATSPASRKRRAFAHG